MPRGCGPSLRSRPKRRSVDRVQAARTSRQVDAEVKLDERLQKMPKVMRFDIKCRTYGRFGMLVEA